MAKRAVEQDGGADKGGMEILYIKVNGSNATLQQGMRTLVEAMNRPISISPPPTRRLVTNQNTEAPPAQEPDLFNQEPAAPEVVDAADADHADAGASTAQRRKRGEGTKTERNAGISPVADLDFVPKDKVALKTFFSEKSPTTDMEQVLVIGYYLQQMLDVSTFGPGHILAGFKHVNKRIPVDLRQTMRNMKPMVGSKQGKGWLAFTDIESARLTTEGENVVEHDLPRKGNGDDAGSK